MSSCRDNPMCTLQHPEDDHRVASRFEFPGKVIARLRRGGLRYLIIVAIGLLFVLPFAWMVSTSLQPNLQSVYATPPNWVPKPPTWSNYIRAWNSAPFTRYMVNSLAVSFSVMILQVINSCLVAYALSWLRIPGRNILFVVLLFVLMIPSQVTMVPVYIVLSRLKWIDTYMALIVPFGASAFGIFLLRQTFLVVPRDLVDAAIIDGASHFGILRHVMLPLSKPAIVTLALLSFNWRWNDYFWTLLVTNSVKMRTLPIGIATMRAGLEGASQWHLMMAGTVIVLLPVLILFIFFQRYFVEGISRTGLKG